MPSPNGFKQALEKFPLHFLGFGVPFGILAFYTGWGSLVVLATWRGYEEYLDWHQRKDTLGKALIDFYSQIAGTSLAVLLKYV